ncbi:coiled-coil domain-containing protein 106-like [Sphaeramia orbicularis]|uniref:coiled-coil domain-containing protein 106-like n=1 Tax=Sphaeramia orbicularis TaxID=375764 RepID=UPI00117D1980|nr:coiled-coil domain-containing protein 106-like [Sphaeramia orbicularis]
MAPTAKLIDKRKSQELEMFQLKMELQQEKIDELIKERDYLKEQLTLGKSPYTHLMFVFGCILTALKKEKTGSTEAIDWSSPSSCDSLEVDSSDAMSDSSTNSSSSDEGKKKRRKKGKEKKSTSKKKEPKTRRRVQNPYQVVSRNKKILRLFSRGGTMSAAFKRVGVDRNTVVATAPIAELFIAAPCKYEELLKKHNPQVKLSAFAAQCVTSIQEDPGIHTVESYKVSGKLLPLKHR